MLPTDASRRVAVIGGGVGGLAAAIRLAIGGCRVSLYEQNATLGGKLNLRTVPHPDRPNDRPFRFDTGPSLVTLPFVFEQLFAAAGVDLHDRLELIRLDPVSRFEWPDGSSLQLRKDRNDTLDSVHDLAPRDVDGFRRFLDRGKHVWDLSGELFLQNAPEQLLKGKLGPKQGLGLLTVPFRIGMFGRYSKLVDRHVKDERLRAVLYQYATYSGASPWKAPATLCVIPHAETHFGGWYIKGGLYKLAEALTELAVEKDVEIHTETPVEKVTVKEGVADGLNVDGRHVEADTVVCNADTITAYRRLIDAEHRPHWQDKKLDALDPGGSGMVLLLGVEGTLPQVAHHTKYMPDNYFGPGGDLQAMFVDGRVPDDPCVYVCRPTATDATVAPEGCENLFVLVSAPAMHGPGKAIDWEIEGPRYRDRVLDILENRCGLTGLRQKVVVEDTWTPPELGRLYGANAGAIYGVGGNGRKQAFLRPPNRDPKIKNLFFVGGATHPGGGLPLVALSGKITCELILGDFSQF